METEAVGIPWAMLAGGLAALAYGIALRRGAPWIGAPLTARERRGSALMLIGIGAAWLFVFWSSAWPFYNQLKPYAVVILTTALWPLAIGTFTVWFLYFGLIRFFRKPPN